MLLSPLPDVQLILYCCVPQSPGVRYQSSLERQPKVWAGFLGTILLWRKQGVLFYHFSVPRECFDGRVFHLLWNILKVMGPRHIFSTIRDKIGSWPTHFRVLTSYSQSYLDRSSESLILLSYFFAYSFCSGSDSSYQYSVTEDCYCSTTLHFYCSSVNFQLSFVLFEVYN